MTHTYYEVIDTPISIEEVTNKVIRRECGAVTTFIGTVREFTKGRRTLCLEYVAYKTMAEKQLERIGTEVGENWPGIYVAITHRIGTLQISDLAVVVAVSTPHRKVPMRRTNILWSVLNKLFQFGRKSFGKMVSHG